MKKNTVGIIIQNDDNKILLLLRDNKPNIPYPSRWYIPGGVVEAGETPQEAITREMKEEMELKIPNILFFRTYDWPEKIEHMYYAKMNLDAAHIQLHEGQKIQYFDESTIEKMDLGFHDNKIAEDYFSSLKGST
ncbi:MAG: NUDIX domain-containing protein [Patescibacteria group bacterium]